MEFSEVIRHVGSTFPEAVVSQDEGTHYLQIVPEQWRDVALHLRDDSKLRFDALMCLTGFDKGPGQSLGVIYSLHSMEHDHKLEVRIEVARDGGAVPSAAHVWRTADWHEREAYDMFGITFTDHPDHRRMLLPDDWIGHPLRKDYETPDDYRGIPVPKDKRGWE
ncbi:MAG: NADH-quinone oxidoreductase subunit C [Fidelibacterota bacterium]|nr:MAG: NADH-quinone oxidoreductase subunit C [Candidatus Neomarinimicrobiota bacterium]